MTSVQVTELSSIGIEKPAVAARARLLVVEDDEALSALLTYNLEAQGYWVETLAHGDQVEPRLRKGQIDLLLLDWMLPGCSGLEICGRIREQDEMRRLPVIILTARRDERDRVFGTHPLAPMTTLPSHFHLLNCSPA